jgi:hypothetical protein
MFGALMPMPDGCSHELLPRVITSQWYQNFSSIVAAFKSCELNSCRLQSYSIGIFVVGHVFSWVFNQKPNFLQVYNDDLKASVKRCFIFYTLLFSQCVQRKK